MEIAIAKLEYLLKAAKNSLKEYKKEQYEISSLFSIDDELTDIKDEVTFRYSAEIKSYEAALKVLKNTKPQ